MHDRLLASPGCWKFFLANVCCIQIISTLGGLHLWCLEETTKSYVFFTGACERLFSRWCGSSEDQPFWCSFNWSPILSEQVFLLPGSALENFTQHPELALEFMQQEPRCSITGRRLNAGSQDQFLLNCHGFPSKCWCYVPNPSYLEVGGIFLASLLVDAFCLTHCLPNGCLPGDWASWPYGWWSSQCALISLALVPALIPFPCIRTAHL